MENTQRAHGEFINQYLGEQKFKRFVMPILIGVLSGSAGVALMALIFRGLIAGMAKGVP